MSTVNDDPALDREESRKLYEESDRLLRLAEGLQDKCEQYERRLGMLVVVCASIGIVFGIVGIYFINRAIQAEPVNWVDNTWNWAALVTVIYDLAVVFYMVYMRAKILRQITRERRALHGIGDLLRDLEKGIVEKNNLSTLERAEFRIRLSRFDIGPGK